MRQHLDLPKLYRDALRRLPESNDGQPVLQECPVTLEKLLAAEP